MYGDSTNSTPFDLKSIIKVMTLIEDGLQDITTNHVRNINVTKPNT